MRGKEVGGAEVFDMSPGRTRTLLSIDANFRVWTKWCPLEDTASFVTNQTQICQNYGGPGMRRSAVT
jgi:hypothetical protein